MRIEHGKLFSNGQRVVYVPGHAHGDIGHKDCEAGVVVGYNRFGETVFVRFKGQAHVKGCNGDDLVCLGYPPP